MLSAIDVIDASYLHFLTLCLWNNIEAIVWFENVTSLYEANTFDILEEIDAL